MIRTLTTIYVGLFLVLVALTVASYAHGGTFYRWPAGQPTSSFKLVGKNEPTLLCAQFRLHRATVINCKLVAARFYLSWPPSTATPVRTWKSGADTCEQWNATRAGKYAGLVARCDPTVGPLAAMWWIVDGSWGRRA